MKTLPSKLIFLVFIISCIGCNGKYENAIAGKWQLVKDKPFPESKWIVTEEIARQIMEFSANHTGHLEVKGFKDQKFKWKILNERGIYLKGDNGFEWYADIIELDEKHLILQRPKTQELTYYLKVNTTKPKEH